MNAAIDWMIREKMSNGPWHKLRLHKIRIVAVG